MKLRTFSAEPISVRRAVLGFSGWPDAGRVVEYTLSEFKRAFPSELCADWDLDGFWHAESTRPRVTVEHGQIQKLESPVYHFWLLTPPDSGPFLLGAGPEPTINWGPFVRDLLDLLARWGCQEITLLGAFYDQIFHDDIVVSGIGQGTRAYNQLHDLKCHQIEYTGPSAIHSPIIAAAQEADLYCLSFWAHYPFYLSGRHESLMARMLQILGQVLDLEIETRHLVVRWKRRAKDLEELVQNKEDLAQALESLKKDQPRRPFFGQSAKVIRLDEFLKKREDPPSEKE